MDTRVSYHTPARTYFSTNILSQSMYDTYQAREVLSIGTRFTDGLINV